MDESIMKVITLHEKDLTAHEWSWTRDIGELQWLHTASLMPKRPGNLVIVSQITAKTLQIRVAMKIA